MIGQYGSGKSHLLAYLAQGLRAGTFMPEAPDVLALSLLNFRADTPLEQIVAAAAGAHPERPDRRDAWTEVAARHPHGLVLLLDELSEFLRSRPRGPAFSEDVRFLQFLGEWAQDRRFFVVAAMQEQIEHTGELEQTAYRKIKDRYPLRLTITPAHVRGLVADHVLVKLPGYEGAVSALVERLRAGAAGAPIDFPALATIYPLHPATLELLEEVRESFSRSRGAIEFVVGRLAGDPARGISPFLDEQWGSLITPDAIVSHFRDLFEIQPEFLPLAQKVFPYYERHLGELFETDGQRRLADRLVKLLALVYLSPRRNGLVAEEAAAWLLLATRLDPARNLAVVARVLETLATRGRYVKAERRRYRLDPEDDGLDLDTLVAREIAELQGRGDALLELLAPLLAEDRSPLSLPRDGWQGRPLRWHYHERPYAVWLGDGAPTARDGVSLVVRLPWGAREPAPGFHTVVPALIEPGAAWLELAALSRLRERPLPRPTAERLERRLGERLGVCRDLARAAFADAATFDPDGRPATRPLVDRGLDLDGWLEAYGLWVLRRTYPAFERFAPTYGPLPQDSYRALLRFAAQHDLAAPAADEAVKVIREGYLVPMRLLERQGPAYRVAPRLERHELVKQIEPLLASEPTPVVLYEHLQGPIYGLVPDQVHVLLLFLFLQGHIDILSGSRSLREAFETLPLPRQHERVVPGRSLRLDQLGELDRLCDGLRLQKPRQWTVLAQRRAAEQLRELGGRVSDRLAPLARRLDGLGQGRPIADRIRRLLVPFGELEHGEPSIDTLDRFLGMVGSAGRYVTELAVLEKLPERIDRQLAEVGRLGHLLSHPALLATADESLEARLEALGTAPDLDDPDALDAWLARAGAVYESYRQEYRRRHDHFWDDRRTRPEWRALPPSAAASRHLGLDEELRELSFARERAATLACRAAGDLRYEPRCPCGFDGHTAPVDEALARLRALGERIDEETRRFFDTPEVRARLGEWDGLPPSPENRDYLAARRPWPEVDEVARLDRWLAGVDAVKEIDARTIVDLLLERTWEPAALAAALAERLAAMGAARLRFVTPDPQDREAIALFCGEHALRAGVPLPAGLSRGELERIGAALRQEWIGPEALAHLEDLGLDEQSVQRVIGLLLQGEVTPPPPGRASPLVSAALELVRPSAPADAAELGALAERLYRHHRTLARVAPEPWLARLEALATVELDAPPLGRLLAEPRHRDAQWLVLDGCGLPLWGSIRDALGDLLPAWHLQTVAHALAPGPGTTAAFFRDLAASGISHPFEKLDAIDTLLHARFVPLDDLARLALAELRLAAGALRRRLDPARPLCLFADHGFRLAPDGQSYRHGGSSTLERLVPVALLAPR